MAFAISVQELAPTFGLSSALPERTAILLESAGLVGEKLDAYHVGFVLAPRLNAAGRMGHASLAVELLTLAPPQRCVEIAQYLVQQNTQRQAVEREIAQQAITLSTGKEVERFAKKRLTEIVPDLAIEVE